MKRVHLFRFALFGLWSSVVIACASTHEPAGASVDVDFARARLGTVRQEVGDLERHHAITADQARRAQLRALAVESQVERAADLVGGDPASARQAATDALDALTELQGSLHVRVGIGT